MNVYELPTTKEVARFLYAALRFPTKATLLTAAWNGNLIAFPGFTMENISKHFPESDETAKGHMKQSKQGMRSTKVINEDIPHVKQTPGAKHKDVYLRVFDATNKSVYTNRTGKFHIQSSRGSKYIMVAVKMDSNYIGAKPMRTEDTKSLITAYQAIYARWKSTGVICPNWHMIDNEAPNDLKAAKCASNCTVELTPPHQHRRNAAKRAIQMFTGHFIAVLAGISDNFPIHQWDKLLPKTILTLNLLRQANVATNISAYSYHNGSFDYNRMPLAPVGCAVQVHIKPTTQKTFGEHSSDGWYLRTSSEHYRSHVVFVKATKSKRITDTVFFKHKYITQPTVTDADAIVNAYHNLVKALQGLSYTNNQAHLEAIQRIQESLAPGNTKFMEKHVEQHPRVEQEKAENAAEPITATPHPRVSFCAQIAEYVKPKQGMKTWMIVMSLQKPVVVLPKPAILHPPKYYEEPDTIAARLKACRNKVQTVNDTPEETIADRVARRQ
eukprot:CCRYP_005642-RB/>CCRYP_005642-RB protein AED:0.41 eAED:0.34 QI:0/-1/0/1/-1/1/1/0/496